ncbi:metal-dependent hydrolase [Halohasta salina]|uniref:metal-dependent hydrolase n=1 Tax=Halohasta salina TaxID=2961621 RepID=UPI0020A3B657|nr:metal-dependent hydrolase [Halohasta salina]
MAEWVSHVCLAYALFTVAGWAVDWLDGRWIAVGVVGSILPDLDRLDLVVSDEFITAATGVPFEWAGINSIGGAVVLSAIGALLFTRPSHQRRGFLLLFAGACSHLVVDLPQRYADGLMLTNKYLFPLPPWRPPTPGWYVSADRWVAVVAVAVALVVFLVDRYRSSAATVGDQ